VNVNDIKKQATDKMAKSVESLRVNLTHVRTGRAHVGLLDAIRVDYYGSEMPINQVANVTLADSRTISIQPYEKKMVQVVEKAIRDSDLGVNPATSGDVIRVPMPALTEERRRELGKLVHREGEDALERLDALVHLLLGRLLQIRDYQCHCGLPYRPPNRLRRIIREPACPRPRPGPRGAARPS